MTVNQRESFFFFFFLVTGNPRTMERGLCAYSSIKNNHRVRNMHLNPHMYTASHRTLPLNSLVNVHTGRNSITVRITDHRTLPGHMLELSTKAAMSLHINGDTPMHCVMTVIRKGRSLHQSCKHTWYGVCRSASECCSGHCIHTLGSAGVCVPHHFRPTRVSRISGINPN